MKRFFFLRSTSTDKWALSLRCDTFSPFYWFLITLLIIFSGRKNTKKNDSNGMPKKLFFESQLENILKPLAVLRVRDVEGAEGGAERSASGVKHGSEADPGTSPTPSEARGNALVNVLMC